MKTTTSQNAGSDYRWLGWRLTPQVSMQEEISQALKLCSRSKAAVVEMFSDLRMGRAIELEGIGGLVEDISNSLLRNSHALISVARLKQSDV
ncbi:DUF3391 domain-containing protein [Pseudomonas sp.]|uniref:DUF3391 domain-containing protein n=1 Tax=Pseudomonas sp. TaxID=306 RepID=UPI003FD6C65A